MSDERSLRHFSLVFFLLGTLILAGTVWWLMKPLGQQHLHLVFAGLSKGHIQPFLARFDPYKDQRMGGAAHKAAKLQELVASFSGDPFCIFSTGSELSGTAEAYFTRGAAVIEALNAYRLDGMLVGNLEFTFGRMRLEELGKVARFPLLSSNIAEEGSEAPPSFITPELLLSPGNGLRVGVLGLTPPTTPELTSRGNVNGLRFLPPGPELAAQVTRLRGKGADVVVLLTLMDRDRVGQPEWESIVAAKPDVISMIDFNVDAPPPVKQDGIVIKTVSGYNQGKELDVLDLEVLPRTGITAFHGRRISIESDNVTPDPMVETLLQKAVGDITRIKTEQIGVFAADYERTYDSECPIGNLVADAMRSLTGADIAIQNSGGIQSNIRRGPFTLGDLYNVLPFDNQIVTMSLSGQDLLEVLTTSASLRRGVLQISGGAYTFANRSSDDFELKDVTIGGRPLEPGQGYKVAVNSFLAEGGDEFRGFKRGRSREYGPIQREAVKAYITTRCASGPLELRVEGRIRKEAP
ncbi:MAG TPA: bifunctional UDP-sugar hydrolase/5'-nucleotidase [Candidatus Ozemobacteraceae bacterium]|nr:bifunctional UDP-sugar hydrolase/5'-nucleotidase [Candidatus Ozemobacteraceae bacterium]